MRKSTTKHTNAINSWFPYSLFDNWNKVRFISLHVSLINVIQCCGVQRAESRTRERPRRASGYPAERVRGRRSLKHVLLLVVPPMNRRYAETGRFRGADDTLYRERLVRNVKKKHNYQSVVQGAGRPVMLDFTQLRNLQRGWSLSHRSRRRHSLEPFAFLHFLFFLERLFDAQNKASPSRRHGNFGI